MKAIPDYTGNVEKLRQKIKSEPYVPMAPFVAPGHDASEHWRRATAISEALAAEWQPMDDRILLKLLPDPLSDPDLLIVPVNPTKQRRCQVLRVGPGKRHPKTGNRLRLQVKPGDVVVIGNFDDWQNFAGDYVICQEADVRYIEVRDDGRSV